MEQSKKLYPLLIDGDALESQSLVANGFLAGNSIEDVIDTYMTDALGLEVFKYFRGEFPLSISHNHIIDFTPLMVCPDDETSLERFGIPGNVKVWYVKSASPFAKIVFGFRQEMSASEFFEYCHKGILENCLQVIRPQAGDFILIPPGTVHAIGGDIDYVEICDAHKCSYHLYELDADKKKTAIAEESYAYDTELFDAIDIIDYKPSSLVENYASVSREKMKMFSWPLHLVAKYAVLDQEIKVLPAIAGSFIAYFGISGSANLNCNGVDYAISENQLLLVPEVIDDYTLATAKQSGEENASVLEIYIPPIDLECDDNE